MPHDVVDADHPLEVFGPDRLVFGSHWPVWVLVSGYGRRQGVLGDLRAELSPDENAAARAGTAWRVHRLEKGHA